MKYKIALTLLLIGNALTAFGQGCDQRTTTTDPSVTSGYDWRELKLADTTWIGSEAWVHIKGVFNSPQNANIGYLADPIKDMEPEDGWELIFVDIGEDPNGPNGNSTNHPMLVLYNKYRSVMRIFVCVTGTNEDYSNSSVYITWDEFSGSSMIGNANLSAYQGQMNALDSFNKQGVNISLRNYNHWENNGGNPGGYYWLKAEFPVMYDPCVCYHESKFNIGSTLIKSGDLSYKIFQSPERGQKPVSSGSANSSSNGFGRVMGKIGTGVKKGSEYKKTLSGVHSGLQDVLGFIKGTTTDETPFKFPKWTKNLANAGTILGIAELLISGGSKKSGSTPTTFTIPNLSAKGTIEFKSPYGKRLFLTPGSKQVSSHPTEIPKYDNPLGIINLLETPKLEYVDYFLNHQDYLHSFDPLHINYQMWDLPRLRQYKVKNDLKYVVNPHSGLELLDIQAKIVFTMGGKPDRVIADSGTVYRKWWDVTHDSFPGQGGLNKLVNYGPYGPVVLGRDTSSDMRTAWKKMGITLDMKSDSFPGINRYNFGTPWSPLGCFSNTSFMLTKYGSGYLKNEPNLACKVRAVFKRKDDPTADEVIWIGTFKVGTELSSFQDNVNNRYILMNQVLIDSNYLTPYYDTFEAHLVPRFTDTSLFRKDYYLGAVNSGNRPGKTVWPLWIDNSPENLVFENTHVASGRYFARKKITIGPNVTMDKDIVFRAGEDIEVLPNVETNTGVVMEINRSWHPLCDREVSEVSDSEVYSFCNDSNKYRPGFVSSSPIAEEELANVVSDLKLSLFPNPVTDILRIDVVGKSKVGYTLEVIDLNGKGLIKERVFVEGVAQFEMDISSLAAGVYILTASNGEETVSQKVVKR